MLRRKYLLLDSRVVQRIDDASLVLGQINKHPANPLFGEDTPWEPRYDNMYPNVIYDEEQRIYKCWYTPFVTSELEEKTPHEKRKSVPWRVSKRMFGLCYATSKDGLKWEKPALGLVDFRGSKRHNILMFRVHGPGIVKDMREADPARRYKMFGTVTGMGPHMVWFSPDGLRWSEPLTLDVGGRSDTRNNVLWSPERNEWVAITRFGGKPRTVGRTASGDFLQWSQVQEVLKPAPGEPQLHDMVAFRYEGLYLGLLGMYDVPANHQWVELTWSPDTVHWHRILPGTPFIPNGPKEGDYDWGCVFAAQPVIRADEIRLYYAGCNGKFYDWRDGFLCLATVGKDRWAGYRSEGGQEGTVVTHPVDCRSNRLTITADAKGGSVRVTVLDETGKDLIHCQPISEDVTDRTVADLSAYVGNPLRLRFELRRATIYSFALVDP